MDSLRAFDDAARNVELRLAELRRLLAGVDNLSEEQQKQLDFMLPTLEAVGNSALALRNELLNAPETPQSFVERGYESLPAGFDPTGWTTETYVTPVTAAWGQQFAEKPGGEVTVDSLFEARAIPAQVQLPLDADLSSLLVDLEKILDEPMLFTGRNALGEWCVVRYDRSFGTMLVFRTEAERGVWLGRAYASTLKPDADENRDNNLDEGDPTSRVPLQPIPPATPVGAGRTLAEALEEPRNP
ncbi:MAG: hypothetical protein QM758_03815 [Armatimonas sp.]